MLRSGLRQRCACCYLVRPNARPCKSRDIPAGITAGSWFSSLQVGKALSEGVSHMRDIVSYSTAIRPRSLKNEDIEDSS